VALLDAKEYHGPGGCPDCDEPHCSDHTQCGSDDVLAEAVRMLHSQAHNSPSDTFSAERCHREPCRTVAGLLGDDNRSAQIAFTPGSRVA